MSRPPEPMPRAEAAAVLGVDAAADPGEVQRAFLRAARRVHPDVLGDAEEAQRREAADAFVRLSRARDALLTGSPSEPLAARPSAGPVFRPVPGRGLGGSLVVLALLAFLLVGLVSLEQGFRGGVLDPPPPATGSSGP